MNAETMHTTGCPASMPASTLAPARPKGLFAWIWDRLQAYQRARSERLMWTLAQADPRVARELQILRDRNTWDQQD